MANTSLGRDDPVTQGDRHVDLDRPAAEVAESVLCEWLHWFGAEMDLDDARALERAIDAFRAAGGRQGYVGRN